MSRLGAKSSGSDGDLNWTTGRVALQILQQRHRHDGCRQRHQDEGGEQFAMEDAHFLRNVPQRQFHLGVLTVAVRFKKITLRRSPFGPKASTLLDCTNFGECNGLE